MRETLPSDQPAHAGASLADLDEMADRLAAVLATSTADETEICWVESAGGRAAAGQDTAAGPHSGRGRSRSLFVRAREGSRWGSHRTSAASLAELEAAVRQAVAASRGSAPREGVTLEGEAPGAGAVPQDDEAPLWDPEVATLGPLAARELLGEDGGRGTLAWTLCRVAVATSGGARRSAQATSVTLRRGTAAASARFLADLDPAEVAERARRRDTAGSADDGEIAPTDPLLFSQEAVGELVAVLAHAALSSSGFTAVGAPLAGMLGEHVFAPTVDLVDDGRDPAGIPFPFDLLGRPKRRISLIEAGVPRTPATDEELSLRLRRPPTPHAVGPDEARPDHLFLLPRHDEEAVLAAGEGGIWVSGFDRLECFDPGRLAVRARLVDARRLRGGELAGAFPDLVWEDSLLRLFSRVRAVGGPPVRQALGAEALGGVSAPLLAVDGAERLEPLAP